MAMETSNSVVNSIADKFQALIHKLVGNPADKPIYVFDHYKIVIIKIDSSLRPIGVKINEEIFLKLDDDNFIRLMDILIKKYSIEIFHYFENFASDLYNFFETVKKEIPEATLSRTQDQAIRQLIVGNLKAASISGHSLRNMVAVKTNGMLEQFQVFIVDPKIKQLESFKNELPSFFLDIYLKYLMLLKQQKQIVLRQLQ
jgi:hypothetical protein